MSQFNEMPPTVNASTEDEKENNPDNTEAKKNKEKMTLQECIDTLFKGGEIPKFKSELELWGIIEYHSELRWGIKHDACDGRGSFTDVQKKLLEASDRLFEMIEEPLNEFDVVYPNVKKGEELPPPPEGKIYYGEWVKKMKIEYENFIEELKKEGLDV